MKGLSQLFRLIHINFILAKHGLDEILFATKWFAPVRFLVYFNPWTWVRDKDKSRGERIRLALEELGPIFVKFGQTLSTRPDLIPDDIVSELSLLQDKVPPFSGAKQELEKIYQQPLSTLFIQFDETPFASASVAQVHAGTLHNNRPVVVKILRPGIEKIIKRDISLLYSIANLALKYWSGSKRLKPLEVIAEFEYTILSELDLMREAANASLLRRNFRHSNILYIPEIYWPYTRHKVIVMERIEGIPVADVEQLKAKGVDLKKLAARGVEIFFTQVFRDCFFHADMHPGNIFVCATNPLDPTYIAVDFGIMGSLSPRDQRYLAENLLAFFKRDYRRVAQLHIDSGWVPANCRLDEFEAGVRTVCEPIFERPLKDISFGYLLLRLFQTGKRFNMEIQPQLLLLQKTLIHIEGLGRVLDPELDLWVTAKPFIEKWVKQQMGPKAFFHKVKENFPLWLERLPEVPGLVYQTLQHFKAEEIREVEKAKQQENESEVYLADRKKLYTEMAIAFLLMGVFSFIVGEDNYFSVMRLGLIFIFTGVGLFLVSLLSRNKK